MSRIDEIRQKLKEWCSAGAPQPTMLGVVKSVNEKEQTCVIEDDGLEYPNVRLSPVLTGNDGLTIIPVVGKYALCARIENDNEWYLVDAEEVFKYSLKIKTTLFEVTGAGVKMETDGVSLKDIMSDLLGEIKNIQVMSGAEGTPSGLPINALAFTSLENRMKKVLR